MVDHPTIDIEEIASALQSAWHHNTRLGFPAHSQWHLVAREHLRRLRARVAFLASKMGHGACAGSCYFCTEIAAIDAALAGGKE